MTEFVCIEENKKKGGGSMHEYCLMSNEIYVFNLSDESN
jgi:hypothetical protein